jgi:hypothetical protein
LHYGLVYVILCVVNDNLLGGYDMKVLTFTEWVEQFDKSLYIHGKAAEDGYAWYLEGQLGRTPTTQEVKRYGKITLLTTD